MYKFLYLWMLWLILLLLSTLVQTGGKIHSGMLLIYDAIDTSLWEIRPETLEASLWLDFDSPLLSISPYSFRVDRQSIIYFRHPPIDKRSLIPSELVERDVQTGIEMPIIKAHWISLYEMPSADLMLIQFTRDNEIGFCVLAFATDECSPASQALLDFLRDGSIIWQNNAGYVLTETALYHFDSASLSWELLLENAWYRAYTATYDTQRNRLYIAGAMESSDAPCRSSQLIQIDLDSLQLELAPFELEDCLSSFDKMMVSPDGRYLQYDTNDVVIIDMQSGELIYSPFWYSDRALWMTDSQRLLFTYYDQINSSGNRISQVNIFTGEISVIYEGTAGYVWLYQVP